MNKLLYFYLVVYVVLSGTLQGICKSPEPDINGKLRTIAQTESAKVNGCKVQSVTVHVYKGKSYGVILFGGKNTDKLFLGCALLYAYRESCWQLCPLKQVHNEEMYQDYIDTARGAKVWGVPKSQLDDWIASSVGAGVLIKKMKDAFTRKDKKAIKKLLASIFYSQFQIDKNPDYFYNDLWWPILMKILFNGYYHVGYDDISKDYNIEISEIGPPCILLGVEKGVWKFTGVIMGE